MPMGFSHRPLHGLAMEQYFKSEELLLHEGVSGPCGELLSNKIQAFRRSVQI